jgi:hypothetical protein
MTPRDEFPGIPAAAAVELRMISLGIDVRFIDDLGAPYAADAHTGRVWLPTGIDFPTAHARLDRCWLYLLGGSRLAPEFGESERQPLPRAAIESGHAAVIPLPLIRRQW